MFKCLKCGSYTSFSSCCYCGYSFKKENEIYILTNDPDMNLDEDKGDKYIGYEHIGEYYSGKQWYKISEKNLIIGRTIAEITGDGMLLDLACGDGFITVPAAKYGSKIISADISKKMLSLMLKKAEYNNISLKDVTVCRMNILNIPIADNSVDCVTANGVLHLISNPEKVLSEIKRVLKSGGKFIALDDAPGKSNYKEADLNKKYHEIANNFYKRYWELLMDENIKPKKYSWKFDKAKACNELFKNKSVIRINYDGEYINTFGDGMLHRISGRGFSDQADVHDIIHKRVLNQVIKEFTDKYGEEFKNISFYGKENDIIVELYEK